MTETVQVAVDQEWADDDPRSSGRRIRITEVDTVHERARGVVLSVARNVAEHQVGKQTRWIALKRFRPGARGYRLVLNPATHTAVAG